jgi:hypothetical protein
VPFTASPAQLRQAERWFVRQGTPTMIAGYGFTGHVLPRMLPVLALVAAASLAWLVPLRSAGSWRWVLLAAVIVIALIVWVSVSAYLRRRPRFSRATTIAILASYVAMPVAVPLLQLGIDGTITPPGGSGVGLLGFVLFFAAAFGAAWSAPHTVSARCCAGRSGTPSTTCATASTCSAGHCPGCCSSRSSRSSPESCGRP